MTRRWVKKELKKNPLERFVIKTINYVIAHKNEVIAAVVGAIIIGAFIVLMIRSRIQDNIKAGRIFSSAQADYESLKYEDAAEKFGEIINEYAGSSVADMAYYLQGLSYFNMEEFERSRKVFEEAVTKHKKSNLIPHINISQAKVYKELGKYDAAVEQYQEIADDHYLYPEAMLGKAAAYELMEKEDSAVSIYRRLNSNYTQYAWGELAARRLDELDVDFSPPDPSGMPVPEPEIQDEEIPLAPQQEELPLGGE